MKTNVSEKWSQFLSHFKWVIVLLFMVMIVFGGAFGSKLPTILSGGGWDVENSQSLKVKELVREGFVGRGSTSLTIVIRDDQHEVGTPVYNEKLQTLVDELRKREDLESIYTWLDAPEQARGNMTGKDKFTSIGLIGLNIDDGMAINKLPEIQANIKKKAEDIGITAYLVGVPAFWGDVAVYSQEGLAKAEMIVLPLIILVLLFIFRSVISTVVALLVTVISIVASMGIIYFIGSKVELSLFVTNAVVMLGMGVGIDYSLITIHRFKQELVRNNGNLKVSVQKTIKTAGHTVLFSGITVISAMAALFIIDLGAIRSIALGAVIVVGMAVITNLTLLPIVLGVLGKRMNMFKIPFIPETISERNGSWYRWTHKIMKRPVVFLTLSVLLLLILAFPAKDLQTFTPDERILPSDSPVRQGITMFEESFGVGTTNPITIVLHSEEGKIADLENLTYMDKLIKELDRWENSLNVYSLLSVFEGKSVEHIHEMTKDLDKIPDSSQLILKRFLNEEKNTAVIDIHVNAYAASDESLELAKRIKSELINKAEIPQGVGVYVGGQTLEGHEANKEIEESLIPVLALMLVFIYLILFLTFKSVFLPLKAIAMNVLSVSATYGVVVFVIAQGNGAELLNIDANGYIQNFVPILLLTLLFGLSTDYEVFVLSRVKEEFEKNHNNDESVAIGLSETGPLISGAALLMIVVFGGFALSGMLPIQTLGFGMAVAVLLDATLVRFILVPASMKLLGNLNWWSPLGKRKVIPQSIKRNRNI